MSRDLPKHSANGEASISTAAGIDKQALAEMVPEVYEELRRLAAS